MSQPSVTPLNSNYQIEHVSCAKLIPYARNSRTHSPDQVAQIAGSIREFGFTNPVLVDSENGIIAGHGRVMAAQSLGMEMVPCLRLGNLTESQKRAYIIADNRLALNAGWDEEMLKLELADLKEDEFDISLVGFSSDELADLLAPIHGDGKTADDDVPDPPKVALTKPGDVWVMGRHRLFCGSATDADAMAAFMGSDKAALWITDPPYNVAYVGKTKDALVIENDSMGDADFLKFLSDAYTVADSVMAPGAVFYIWHADSESYNFRAAAKAAGWEVRQCLVWLKNAFVMGRQDYQWKHEPCLYGWKAGAGHYWGSDRKQSTVLEFDRPSRNGEHPTMKPVELFAYQIENSSKPGAIVLDSFGGSGTTAIACERLGRDARIVELDPIYCDVIVRRWQEFTGNQALHAETGEAFVSQDK